MEVESEADTGHLSLVDDEAMDDCVVLMDVNEFAKRNKSYMDIEEVQWGQARADTDVKVSGATTPTPRFAGVGEISPHERSHATPCLPLPTTSFVATATHIDAYIKEKREAIAEADGTSLEGVNASTMPPLEGDNASTMPPLEGVRSSDAAPVPSSPTLPALPKEESTTGDKDETVSEGTTSLNGSKKNFATKRNNADVWDPETDSTKELDLKYQARDDLYDETLDERDMKWVEKKRNKALEAMEPGKRSDAILSCACSFRVVSIDCQR